MESGDLLFFPQLEALMALTCVQLRMCMLKLCRLIALLSIQYAIYILLLYMSILWGVSVC